jgi:serine/threonine-protein kinase
MGEVYRAEDLKLGQTVALKLLPDHLARDPGRLAQFHNEVRVARTISHRNVCRTYDIGDADGRPFLTMEYVDGEDLASLLRRIGRFPQDKAIEVARQICAGLAAAHERGVLHRDLKPANVMIDGDGHVRLTDFGLAALAGSVDNVRAGTPAYMAPEQLTGREVTPRSDIYALGLVLYELFTGKRAFEASTLNELLKLHESSSVRTPSSVVRDLDPTIERAILRCLEAEPARRPASALAVSAALPGGDPLAAALAGGETPSPEMVAAAGEQSALRPAVGLAMLAFTLTMLALLAAVSQRFAVVHRIPMPRSIDSLRDRAQEIAERLGYREPPLDTVHGWSFNREYFSYVGRVPNRDDSAWSALSTARTSTLTFWYRTSPSPIFILLYVPAPFDPPLLTTDMRLVRLDPVGRLVEFHSVPPQYEAGAAAAAPPDWSALFDAAGLPMAAFHAVEPHWLPRNESDIRAAWDGSFPDLPGITAHVEAAGYGGRPIFFRVMGPWTRAPGAAPTETQRSSQIVTTLSIVVAVLVVTAATLLARRHVRTGRGDSRGAFRTAAVVFACQLTAYLVRARHYWSVEFEYLQISQILAVTLLSAVGLWLLYMAFEPYVRRFWPQLLIGWSRLLSGRVRDPLVGRDVLVGTTAGMIAGLLISLQDIIPYLLNESVATPQVPVPYLLLGTRYAFAGALFTVMRAIQNAMQIVCVVVFLRILVRKNWLVFVLGTVAILPVAMSGTIVPERLALGIAIAASGIGMMFFVLLRFGLLALAVTFYSFLVMDVFPLTTDFTRPYAGTSLVVLLAIASLAIYGYYASRGDEPLFGRTFLD